MKADKLVNGVLVVHLKHNRFYRVVSSKSRLKNSNGEWVDSVIYKPLYDNEFEMFARPKESFIEEFECVNEEHVRFINGLLSQIESNHSCKPVKTISEGYVTYDESLHKDLVLKLIKESIASKIPMDIDTHFDNYGNAVYGIFGDPIIIIHSKDYRKLLSIIEADHA